MQIRFLADPSNEFTSALELDFDASKIFGNRRSVRYALVTENGKVVSKHVEPERTPVDGEFKCKSSHEKDESDILPRSFLRRKGPRLGWAKRLHYTAAEQH